MANQKREEPARTQSEEPRDSSSSRLVAARRWIAWPVLISALALFPSIPASAEPFGLQAAGPRLGLRLNPDQLVLGGQGILWTPLPEVRLTSTATVGFGDNVTIFSLSPEFHYVARSTPIAPETWFYAGGGLDLTIIDWSSAGRGGSDTDLGLVVLAGLDGGIPGTNTTLFSELRILIHGPDDWFEVLVGANFALMQ
jgi:hypothetical protein